MENPTQPAYSIRNNHILIPILCGVILVLLTAIAYLYSYSRVWKSTESEPSPVSQVTSVQETPTRDITWKSYSDPNFGFQFTYPSNLEVKNFGNFGISLWNTPAPDEMPMEAAFPPIHIVLVTSGTNPKTVADSMTGATIALREEESKIDLLPVKVHVNVITGSYHSDDVIYWTSVTNGDKTYLFMLDKTQYPNVSDFYSMLSSVRFTDATSQLDTWKSSAQEKPFAGLPYTFKLPAGSTVQAGTGRFTHILTDSSSIDFQNLGIVSSLESAIDEYRPGGPSDPVRLENKQLLPFAHVRVYKALVQGGGYSYYFIEGSPDKGAILFGHPVNDVNAENIVTKMIQSIK